MLDEPLGALDRPWRERLLREIRTLLDRAHLPALYVTHDHEEAFALAERIVVMRAGRVVQAGAAADVWRRPADEWTAAFLGFAPAVDAVNGPEGLATPWGWPVDQGGDEHPVQVVLRPDALRLDAADRFRGRVVHRAFAGDQALLNVEAVVAFARACRTRRPKSARSAYIDPDDELVLV